MLWLLLAAFAQAPDDDAWVPRAQAALAKDPEHRDALRDLAEWHARRSEWAESLALGERWLALEPDNLTALYNVSVAQQVLGRFEPARAGFSRLLAADPSDWRTLAKLIQLAEALQDGPERDRRRAELLALRASGTLKDLNEAKSFVRDQFLVGGRRVYVSEHFALEGDMAVRYVFGVEGAPTDGIQRVSLGSYAQTSAYLRESMKLPPGTRAWHLDGYGVDLHQTYGIYPYEPTYAQVKSWTIEALEGRLRPASQTSR